MEKGFDYKMQHPCLVIHQSIPRWMITFCRTNVSWHGTNVEAHISHIILITTYVAPSYRTIIRMGRPYISIHVRVFPIVNHPIEWDGGAHMMRLIGYAHFALNKFVCLSITMWYNALPLITIDYAFHTCLTKPNSCMNFSHIHKVLSRLRNSLSSSWTSSVTNHFHTYYLKILSHRSYLALSPLKD